MASLKDFSNEVQRIVNERIRMASLTYSDVKIRVDWGLSQKGSFYAVLYAKRKSNKSMYTKAFAVVDGLLTEGKWKKLSKGME